MTHHSSSRRQLGHVLAALLSTAFLSIVLFSTLFFSTTAQAACNELQDFSATKLRSSKTVNFCEQFGGKAMLVVNTASQCGYTPQFKGLEALHKRYGDKLAIVGFPSDDFNQEHAESEKIADVCYLNYGVTFTMLEPSKVTGDDANPLFKQLAQRSGQQPGWNFTKYLVSADGTQVTHFPSKVTPESDDFIAALEASLKE
ncbi:MAG: glutathione peroxidase [Gammaproteobacteria bacterium]|nr:glutathione peroxidase [Gammaproteobacteria bacterium]